MRVRPLIGLTGRGRRAGQVVGLPAAWDEVPVEVHFGDYSAKVAEAGGLPVMLTSAAPIDALADRLDGLRAHRRVRRRARPLRRRRRTPTSGWSSPSGTSSSWPSWMPWRRGAGRCSASAAACRSSTSGRADRCISTYRSTSSSTTRPPKRVHPVKVDPATPVRPPLPGRDLGQHLPPPDHRRARRRAGGPRAGPRTASIEMIEHEQHRMVAVQWHPELLDDLDPAFTWLVERGRRRQTTVTRSGPERVRCHDGRGGPGPGRRPRRHHQPRHLRHRRPPRHLRPPAARGPGVVVGRGRRVGLLGRHPLRRRARGQQAHERFTVTRGIRLEEMAPTRPPPAGR